MERRSAVVSLYGNYLCRHCNFRASEAERCDRASERAESYLQKVPDRNQRARSRCPAARRRSLVARVSCIEKERTAPARQKRAGDRAAPETRLPTGEAGLGAFETDTLTVARSALWHHCRFRDQPLRVVNPHKAVPRKWSFVEPTSSEVAVPGVGDMNMDVCRRRDELNRNGFGYRVGLISQNMNVLSSGIDETHSLGIHVRLAVRIVTLVAGNCPGCNDDQTVSGMRVPVSAASWLPNVALDVQV